MLENVNIFFIFAEDCQYRTVDAEAFRTHVVSNHGQFAVLSCDFCHKHLHVQPLIYVSFCFFYFLSVHCILILLFGTPMNIQMILVM